MKIFRRALALLFLVSLPCPAQDTVDSNEAAKKLAAILQETGTLQADVTQLTLDQDGREIQEFQARLVMQKPDHFSWEVVSPYQELLMTDGRVVWHFEYDLDQVTIQDFDNDLDRTPVLLLNGNADDLVKSYQIGAMDMDYGSRQRFILHPIQSDSLFERLSLTFAGTTLEEMQFEDSLGQKTSLTFSNVVVNEAIDPGVFTFHEPEGMEVIDQRSD